MSVSQSISKINVVGGAYQRQYDTPIFPTINSLSSDLNLVHFYLQMKTYRLL